MNSNYALNIKKILMNVLKDLNNYKYHLIINLYI